MRPNTRRCRRAIAVVASAVTIAWILPVIALPATVAEASQGPTSVMPAYGQYTPIVPTVVLDTRSGTGETGGAAAMAPGASVTDVPVEGVGSIPTAGVEAAFVNIQVFSPSASGYITDYEADISNPGHASVSFQANQSASGSDIVTLAPDGSSEAGDISFTNNGSATVELAAQVDGYFSDGSQASGQDTYVGLPWTDAVDTRNGTGGLSGPMPANSSWTNVPVLPSSVLSSVPQSDIAAVEVEIGALDGSAAGYLTIHGANDTSSTLRNLSYNTNEIDRLTDIVVPNASGNITINNPSSATVGLQVIVRGVFLLPASSEGGSTFIGMAPQTLCDTRIGCTYDNVDQTTLSQGETIVVQEAGQDGIPNTGVSEVADEINAVNPQASGYLTVNPTGSSNPSSLSAVNFVGGDDGDVTFDDTVDTATSSSGDVSITNNSQGTVDVVVSARGYWLAATVPDAPTATDSSFANGEATVSWSFPDSDGGAAITGFQIALSDGSTYSAAADATSLSVPAVSSDTFTVAAINAMGTGALSSALTVLGMDEADNVTPAEVAANIANAAANTPTPPTMPLCANEPSPVPNGTVSGTVVAPDGSPLANAELQILADDSTDPAFTDSPNYPDLGQIASDSSGCWWYTLPSTFPASPDPLSEVPTLLSDNENTVNLQVSSEAIATVNGAPYPEYGIMEVPDSTGSDGNSSNGSDVLQLYPISQTNQTSTDSPTANSIGEGKAHYTPQMAARSELNSIARAAAGSEGADETLMAAPPKDAYGFETTDPYDPFDVNGVNLQREPSHPATWESILASDPKPRIHPPDARVRRQILRIEHADLLLARREGRVPRVIRPHLIVPINGSAYCYAPANEPGYSCVNYCVDNRAIIGMVWGYIPWAEGHPWANKQSALLTFESGSSRTESVEASIGFGPVSSTVGSSNETDKAQGRKYTVPYGGGNYKQALVTSQVAGTTNQGDCIEVGMYGALLTAEEGSATGSSQQIGYLTAGFDDAMTTYISQANGNCLIGPGFTHLCNPANWSESQDAEWIRLWPEFSVITDLTGFTDANGNPYPTCNPSDTKSWGGADSASDCRVSAPLYNEPYFAEHRTVESKTWMNDTALTNPALGPNVIPTALDGDGPNWEGSACLLGEPATDLAGAGQVAEYVQVGNTNTWSIGGKLSTFGSVPWTVSLSGTLSWGSTNKKQEDIDFPSWTGNSNWVFWGQSPNWNDADIVYSGAPVQGDLPTNCQF